MERSYVLQYKFLRYEQEIIDENHNTIGYVNRYWRNIGQFLGMFVDPSSVLNVKVENEKRELVLQLKVVSRFLALKRRWTGIIYGNPDIHFDLTLNPKLKIGWFMDLQINDRLILVRDRTIGTEPKFLDSDNNMLAKCHDNLTGQVHLDIIDPDLNPYLIAAVTYLIRQY